VVFLPKYVTHLPRERAQIVGIKALADYELLAILLRTGVKGKDVLECARSLLQETNNVQGIVQLSIQQLEQMKGIGASKAVTILAAIELGRRVYKSQEDERFRITCPYDCVSYFNHEFVFHAQESFVALLLNTRNQVIGHKEIYRGGLQTIGVHPREIFRAAIEVSAATCILLHNHPSGDSEPSLADVKTTRELLAAAQIIGIPILDHIILGKNEYTSLKEDAYVEFY